MKRLERAHGSVPRPSKFFSQTTTAASFSLIATAAFVVAALACRAPARVAAQQSGRELNAPAPESARNAVRRAVELADAERAAEAAALLDRTVSAAPNYLRAHVERVRVKTFYLGRYGEARAEYDALMGREPRNPIYPLALALGTGNLAPGRTRAEWFARAASLAPEWAWGHYARAQELAEKDPAAAAGELARCVEKDETAAECYALLLQLQKNKLNRADDALATAEKMSARTETRAAGLAELWRLRLAQAGAGDEARAALKSELDQLVSSSNETAVLAAARRAYFDLLRDREGGRRAEARIRELDAGWFPERGWTFSFTTTRGDGTVKQHAIAGRQVALCFVAYGFGEDLGTKEKIARVEPLLARRPDADLRWYLYTMLLDLAEKSKDAERIVKYASALAALEGGGGGPAWRAKIALALADTGREMQRALRLARAADALTLAPLVPRRPDNTDPDFFADTVTEEWRRENHRQQRALALAAHGSVLRRLGRHAQAATKLRQAAQLSPTEANLARLAEALRGLGRAAEAARAAARAREAFAESVRRGFVNEPAQDFELEAADGRHVRLSELRGRVVMLNFWATWCGPCVKEAPRLVELYERHKGRGFEILAVSIDDKSDRFKVVQFAKDYKYAFPVLFDDGVAPGYRATAVPVSVFIDREGRVRYRESGYEEETPRKFEVVINELLK